MSTDTTWNPFGIPDEYYDEDTPRRPGQRVLNITWRRPKGNTQAEGRPTRPPGSALVQAATALLGILATGLFVVSLAAQFRYVFSAKHQVLPSVIEAVALDLGMVIFSLLALGLARAGQAARIERALVIVCAAGSAGMNFAAANGGSPRSVAAYVMPPVFLAVVVDRVVAVVRRHVLGNTGHSAWTGASRIMLYALRLALALPSTAKGLRRQVLILTPLPDADRAAVTPLNVAALAAAPTPASAAIPTTDPAPGTQVSGTGRRPAGRADHPRRASKRAQLVEAYEALQSSDARYGDRSKVSQVARELAPGAGLAWSSARTSLYRHLDGKASS